VSGGVISSGAGTSLINVLWGTGTQGLIRLVELDKDGCLSDTTNKLIQIGSNGLEDVYFSSLLHIYPNPVNGVLNLVENSGNRAGIVAIALYDMQGKRVFEGTLVVGGSAHDGNLQIDMSQLSSGPYLLKLNDDQHTGTIRIVRE
jgi:hypothetical protein